MAKKISKSIPKPKLTRSSSIDNTINEGKDFVKRSDKVLRIRKAKQAAQKVLPSLQSNTKDIKQKKVNKARKISRSTRTVPALPSPIVASLPIGSSSASAGLHNSTNNQVI